MTKITITIETPDESQWTYSADSRTYRDGDDPPPPPPPPNPDPEDGDIKPPGGSLRDSTKA